MRIFVLVTFLLQLSAVTAGATEGERPNFIFIVADNLTPGLIGPYGNTEIRTPSLDSLAHNGLVFENAFAGSAVCSPSRATILTGLMPSQHGVHNALPSSFNVPNWSAIEELRTLPQTLSDRGYETAMIGKWHLGDPDQPHLGFQHWTTFSSGHTTRMKDIEVLDNGKAYTVTQHLTDFWTERAIDFIKHTDENRPFFLYLSYNGPYNLPPAVLKEPNTRYAEYYKEHTPGMPQEPVHPYLENLAKEMADTDGKGDPMGGWRTQEKTKSSSHEKWLEIPWGAIRALNNKTAMINIASEISMMDEGIGKLVEILQEQGLDDNTIIVFTADQGHAYGQHGLFGNSSWADPAPAFDEHMRVPFIIVDPSEKVSGQRTDIMFAQYDILPTMLGALGLGEIEIADTPGENVLPRILNAEDDPDKAVYLEYILTRVIRTKEWKYIKRFPDGPDELYHLSQDPGEYQNLANSPDAIKTKELLRGRLEKFFEEYSDPQFDVWRGGTAKSTLMYGDDNRFFEGYFANWKQPFVENRPAFSETVQ